MILLLAACFDAPPTPPPGLISWVEESGGVPRVALVDPSGTKKTAVRPPELPKGAAVFPGPADPLGKLLLLLVVEETERGHQESLWTTDLAGTSAKSLGPIAERIRNPAWTVDGAHLWFESDLESFRDLYVVPRNGGAHTRMTEEKGGSFTPDLGVDRVAFASSRHGISEIYTMRPSGTGIRRLTNDSFDDTVPKLSPSGATVAWLSRRGRQNLVVVGNADGSGMPAPLRELKPPAADRDLSWSPDGKLLAVTTASSPKELSIVVFEAHTGKQLAEFDGPGVDENPAWSPSSEQLVFSSGRDGQVDLYIGTIATGKTQRLTNRSAADWLPRWTR